MTHEYYSLLVATILNIAFVLVNGYCSTSPFTRHLICLTMTFFSFIILEVPSTFDYLILSINSLFSSSEPMVISPTTFPCSPLNNSSKFFVFSSILDISILYYNVILLILTTLYYTYVFCFCLPLRQSIDIFFRFFKIQFVLHLFKSP